MTHDDHPQETPGVHPMYKHDRTEKNGMGSSAGQYSLSQMVNVKQRLAIFLECVVCKLLMICKQVHDKEYIEVTKIHLIK